MGATRSPWAALRRLEFFAVTFVFHLIFTWSIFDIYFRSPVVHPAPRYSVHDDVEAAAPAERAVLFVADGLRADTLFKWHDIDKLPEWARADLVAMNAADETFDRAFPSVFVRNATTDAEPVTDAAYVAPYLRSIAKERGTYGVSHTRVPTESRPGHVALLAGMYEDISAVTKGWKVNPIAFDSLLNQSSHTFAYGSPDIVPMFALGAPGKVESAVYDEAAEDFTKDAVALDVWVLDEVRALLSRARTDAELDRKLRAPRTFFFLHLLGLDTTGHTYRPLSPEYLGNTIVVDAIVKEVEAMLDAYFGDDRTAYILTADHGMSHRGNHGDGDPDNTRTPLIAWGAGVPTPQRAKSYEFPTDDYYENWELEAFARNDIDQADLAPLISALVGMPVPANSEGHLPFAYLDAPPAYAAHAARANARQVLEVYRVKHDDLATRMRAFVPYAPLDTLGRPGDTHLAEIDARIAEGDFEEAQELCSDLIHAALRGAAYLHKYDAKTLITVVVLGYIGVILYGVTFLLHYGLEESMPAYRLALVPLAVVLAALAAVWAQFFANRAPEMYFVYSGACACVWAMVALRMHVISSVLTQTAAPYMAQGSSKRDAYGWAIARVVLYAAFTIGMLEAAAYAYTHRLMWTGILLLGATWPFLLSRSFQQAHELGALFWIFGCSMCAVFTALSTEKDESVTQLVLGGLLFFAIGVLIYANPATFLVNADYLGRDKQVAAMVTAKSKENLEELKKLADEDTEDPVSFLPRTRAALAVELVLMHVAVLTTATSAGSLRRKEGLPLANQVAAWSVLVLALAIPFLVGFQRPKAHGGKQYAQPMRQRIVLLLFGFAPIFVLLSLRDEVFFFFCYSLLVLTWAHHEAELARERCLMEAHSEKRTSAPALRGMVLDDVRVGLFYFLLLNVGFFGTGNVASISSFYLSPVYRLLPVFNPFWMAALLVLKLIIPFILLSCVLAALCAQRAEWRMYPPISSRVPILASGLGVRDVYIPLTAAALAGDVLALNFFFALRDTGSWLEIGQSITHFVMANLMQMYMLVIAALGAVLIGARTAHSL